MIHHPYSVIHLHSVIHHITFQEITFLIEMLEVTEDVAMKLEEQILFQRQEHPQIQTQIQDIELEIPGLHRELELALELLLLEQLFQEIYFKIS